MMFLESLVAIALLALFFLTAKSLERYRRPPPRVFGIWKDPSQNPFAGNLNGLPFWLTEQNQVVRPIWAPRIVTANTVRQTVEIPPLFHVRTNPSTVTPEPPGEVQIRLDLTKMKRSD